MADSDGRTYCKNCGGEILFLSHQHAIIPSGIWLHIKTSSDQCLIYAAPNSVDDLTFDLLPPKDKYDPEEVILFKCSLCSEETDNVWYHAKTKHNLIDWQGRVNTSMAGW